jgi:hypothetical protein
MADTVTVVAKPWDAKEYIAKKEADRKKRQEEAKKK